MAKETVAISPNRISGSNAAAAVVSVVTAIAITSLVAMLVPADNEMESSAISLARYLANDFCLLIIAVGSAAVIFSLIQLVGLGIDDHLFHGERSSPFVLWLTGRSPNDLMVPEQRKEDAILNAQIGADLWDTLHSARTAPILYAIWALPLLGFIGTVIGISGAIGGLGAVFSDIGREEALTSVLASLRYAFDTTFLGLAMVLPTMLCLMVLRAKSDILRHLIVRRASGIGE